MQASQGEALRSESGWGESGRCGSGWGEGTGMIIF